ncbi:hypothetical protein, partial [Mycolicibacterium doricum]
KAKGLPTQRHALRERNHNCPIKIEEPAYGQFANDLRVVWIKNWNIEVPRLIAMPPVLIDPGAVARSILIGMCATGPSIQRQWTSLAEGLLSGGPFQMPSSIGIYLALARGKTARVAGPIAGFHVTGPYVRRNLAGVPRGINAIASVYFPPLAWELVHKSNTTLVDDAWVDVSCWTELHPGEIHPFTDLVSGLPAVCHSWHHPSRNEGWAELMDSNLVAIVECFNVEGGPADFATPPTVSKRAHITTDEIETLARRHPMR